MSKVMYQIGNQNDHIYQRGSVFYYVRWIPSDVKNHCPTDRISFSLKTKSENAARRAAKSITQKLEDYWLGIRLQNIDIPALKVVHSEINDNSLTLVEVTCPTLVVQPLC